MTKKVLLTLEDSIHQKLMAEVQADGWGRIQPLINAILIAYLHDKKRQESP